MEFTERGLRTSDGVEHEADTVIYGTGFRAADYLASLDVYGAGGRGLHDDWRDGAEAYLGTVVPGYPNLFTLYGPNTNGVQSIIWIIEAQVEFVRRLLDAMGRAAVQAVDVKQEIHDAYNDEIQACAGGNGLACRMQQLLSSSRTAKSSPSSLTTARCSPIGCPRWSLEHFNCQPANDGRRKDGSACAESTIRQ